MLHLFSECNFYLLEQHHIFNMVRVGKHIDRLNLGNLVLVTKQANVARLGCRIATDIDDPLRCSK